MDENAKNNAEKINFNERLSFPNAREMEKIPRDIGKKSEVALPV
jgi:hypothetical protein